MALSKATIESGSAAIKAQRGTATWGANYTFNSSGLQNDLYGLSDSIAEAKASGVTFSASGAVSIGTATNPVAASGIVMNGAGNVPFALYVLADGTVSGVAV